MDLSNSLSGAGVTGAQGGNPSKRAGSASPKRGAGAASLRVSTTAARETVDQGSGIKRGHEGSCSEPELKKLRLDLQGASPGPDLAGLAALIQKNDIKAIKARLEQDDSWIELELPDPTSSKRKAHNLTPLCLAALHGHTELAELLLGYGAELERPSGRNGMRPLEQAARSGHTQCVRVLLEQGADPNEQDESGNHPLLCAVHAQSSDCVRLLLERGARVDSRCPMGRTALTEACDLGESGMVKVLLDKGANPDLPGKDGCSPLFWAVGCPDTINCLLQGGARFDFESAGDKAFRHAVQGGSVQSAQALYSSWLAAFPDPMQRCEQLHLAVDAGKPEMVEWLLQRGAPVNGVHNGSTPLLVAANQDNPELVELLLRHGAALDVRTDPLLDSVLHRAARSGSHKVLDCLLQTGRLQLDAVNADGKTPLYLAAAFGRLESVRKLLAAGANANAADIEGDTVLIACLRSGKAEIAHVLLAHGATAGLANLRNETPLLWACGWGFLELAKKLHAQGTDLEFASVKGETCLMFAARLKSYEVVKWLLGQKVAVDKVSTKGKSAVYHLLARWPEHADQEPAAMEALFALLDAGADPNQPSSRGVSPLMLAASTGNVHVLQALLSRKAQVNQRDAKGNNALCYAIEWNRQECVRELLAAGADAECFNSQGSTPLTIACAENRPEFVKLLLASGLKVSIDARGRECETAVHWAVQQDDMSLLQSLHKAGADLGVCNDAGHTPLIYFCRAGKLEAAHWLLQQGAGVDAVDKEGWSALHHACFMGHLEVATLLAKSYSAQLNLKDEVGHTPLMRSAEAGHLEVAQMLLDCQADAQAQDDEGWTALHCACVGEHVDVVRLLLDYGVACVPGDVDFDCTAAAHGIATGNLTLVKLLWQRLARANRLPEVASNFLNEAVMAKAGDIVSWLLEQPATSTEHRNAALCHACTWGRESLVSILLDARADMDCANEAGATPLMLAAGGDHAALVKLLLQSGANLRLLDIRGYNAMDFALEENAHGAIEALYPTGVGPTRAINSTVEGSHQLRDLTVDLINRLNSATVGEYVPGQIRRQPLQWFESLMKKQATSDSNALEWMRGDLHFLTVLVRTLRLGFGGDGQLFSALTHISLGPQSEVFGDAVSRLPSQALPAPDARPSSSQARQQWGWLLTKLDYLTEHSAHHFQYETFESAIGLSNMSLLLKAKLENAYKVQSTDLHNVGQADLTALHEIRESRLKHAIVDSINTEGKLRVKHLHNRLTREFGMFRAVADLLLHIAHTANEKVAAEADDIPRMGSEGHLARLSGVSYGEQFIRVFVSVLKNADAHNPDFALVGTSMNDRHLRELPEQCLRDQWRAVASVFGVTSTIESRVVASSDDEDHDEDNDESDGEAEAASSEGEHSA